MFVLYQQDLLKLSVEDALARWEQGTIERLRGVYSQGRGGQSDEVDTLLTQHISGWRIERLGLVERAILRVAAYELIREMDTPVAVIVDEAVNLAKRFCSGEAGALVNGILGGVARQTRVSEAAALLEAKEVGEAG